MRVSTGLSLQRGMALPGYGAGHSSAPASIAKVRGRAIPCLRLVDSMRCLRNAPPPARRDARQVFEVRPDGAAGSDCRMPRADREDKRVPRMVWREPDNAAWGSPKVGVRPVCKIVRSTASHYGLPPQSERVGDPVCEPGSCSSAIPARPSRVLPHSLRVRHGAFRPRRAVCRPGSFYCARTQSADRSSGPCRTRAGGTRSGGRYPPGEPRPAGCGSSTSSNAGWKSGDGAGCRTLSRRLPWGSMGDCPPSPVEE